MKLARSIKLQHLLSSSWPSHIPEQCPKCSSDMNNKVNLYIGRGKLASLLKDIAPWTSVLMLIAIIIFLVLASARAADGGQGTPMAMVAMIVLPSLLLNIIGNYLPKKYKVQCHHCGCQTDYKLKSV